MVLMLKKQISSDIMSHDLTHFNFLKMMKRYGAWRYNLLGLDYITVIKSKNKYNVVVYVNGIYSSHNYQELAESWKMVETEIAKYKEAKQVTEGLIERR